jgi:hypothetical protein
MSFKRILLIGAISAALSGCYTIGSDDPGFAETVKYDTALQTINPAPVYPANAAQPGDNGDKGARAVMRYRTDAVKQVEQMQTTTGTSGSSETSSASTPQN